MEDFEFVFGVESIVNGGCIENRIALKTDFSFNDFK